MSGSYNAEHAIKLFQAGRYPDVVAYCVRFAEQGVASAQCLLGTMYQLGLGVDVDPRAAERLFVKAAEQLDPIAWCNLGTLYSSGALGVVDENRVRFCYQRAFDLGGPSNANYLRDPPGRHATALD
jgi:hypothetical protein